MTAVSLLPILPIVIIASATMKLCGNALAIHPAEGRFASIDGLRGYMAFFVFLHHSCLWYFFTHGYGWRLPPSYVYSQFGATSVAVFFMITSFLFFSKLLQRRNGTIDWLKLYVSRSFRIMPLYLFVLFILVGIVAILSRFMLHEPAYKVLLEVLQWNVFIKADINGLSPTWLIIAGVVWSLPYEWFFYFTLPFYGLLLRVRSSWTVLAFALTGSLFFLYIILNFYQSAGGLSRMLPFLSGIAAAFLARSTRIKKLVSGILPSAVIAVFLILGVGWFRGVDEPIPLLLVSAAFIAIACGNSLFGILTHPLSRTLGQISYSIYLLHGIILFVIFTWVLGYPYAMTLSPLEHWVVIAVCSIGVVTISSLTYFFIEKPALEAAPRVADKIAISPL